MATAMRGGKGKALDSNDEYMGVESVIEVGDIGRGEDEGIQTHVGGMSTADIENFMEDELLVMLTSTGADGEAPFVHVGVNGVTKLLPREQPIMLKRKFVEVLARAQPMNVSTDSGESPGDQITFNNVNRSLSSLCSFSVLEDKNPRGREWLTRVMREG